MFIISHTHAHAQCYRHISPDSYDEPSRFMQKIVSFLPTPLQLKWIFISVTSSSYPWYLPASHSSILLFYIPLVFPLSLPSFLHPSLCFYHLMLGVLSPWQGRGNGGKKGKKKTQEKKLVWCGTFSLVISTRWNYRIILYITVFSLSMELDWGSRCGEEGRRLQGQYWKSGLQSPGEIRSPGEWIASLATVGPQAPMWENVKKGVFVYKVQVKTIPHYTNKAELRLEI